MLEYKGYFGAVEAGDGTFQGRVAGLRDVVTFEGDDLRRSRTSFPR